MDINDNYAGYVGIEYIIKYISKRTNEIVYECLMCELILPTQGMQSHVLGYQHRNKYLNKHFPTLAGDIRNYVNENIPNYSLIMGRIFDEVCSAIEKYHGRQVPKQFNEDTVERDRLHITNEVYSLRHACESNGPMFIELINKIKIDRFIQESQNLKLHPSSSNSGSRQNSFDSITKYKHPSVDRDHRDRLRIDRSRGQERDNYRSDRGRHEDRSRERERFRDYRRGREKSDSYRHRTRSRSRSRERNRSSDHRSSDHRSRNSSRSGIKNPINLSLYDDPPISDDVHKRLVEEFLQQTEKSKAIKSMEAKKVSQAPIEEDLREKLDRNRRAESPYRPDDIWQIYRRMYDQAVISIDTEYKRYRNDPECHPEYNSEWKSFWCKRKEELTRDGIDYKNHDFQIEWIDFFKNRIEELFDEDVEKMKINLRKQLDLPINNQQILAPKYMLKEPIAERVNCLSVLRILTALENDLGSLGPKAVELMAKALMLEKIRVGESDKLLNYENCTFFETVNEKLKGLVLVLGLEGSKLKTITSVISNIETMIAQTTEQRSSNDNSCTATNQSDVDFKKLSLGLAAKGKNVDSEKIKEIISLYNLLSNSKKAKDDGSEKNKSLSATLADLLSPGAPKDGKPNALPTRQETPQHVSSTSEIALADLNETNSSDRFSSGVTYNKF